MSEVILSQNLSGFSSTKFGAVLLPPIIIIHLEGSSHLSSLFGVKPPMNLSVSDVFFSFLLVCLLLLSPLSVSFIHSFSSLLSHLPPPLVSALPPSLFSFSNPHFLCLCSLCGQLLSFVSLLSPLLQDFHSLPFKPGLSLLIAPLWIN